MEKAKEATKDIAKDIGDVLIYALYPTTGLRFLKWKYGLEKPPEETRAKTIDDVKREDELISKLKAGKLAEREAAAAAPSSGLKTYRVYLGDSALTVRVEPAEGEATTTPRAPATPAPPVPKPAPAAPQPPQAAMKVEKKAPPPAKKAGETQIIAPMPGIIIRYEVKAGDQVKADDVILILEAMKMANSITTPAAGTVKAIKFASGDKVARDDVLAVIG
jgi:pyruvate carboxylase subunit B